MHTGIHISNAVEVKEEYQKLTAKVEWSVLVEQASRGLLVR